MQIKAFSIIAEGSIALSESLLRDHIEMCSLLPYQTKL